MVLTIEASASIGDSPIFLGDTVVVEGCNEAAFTVIRPVTTVIDTLDIFVYGTAEEGVDFATLDTTLILEVGENEQQIPLDVFADGIEEGPETVTWSICTSTYVAILLWFRPPL